MEADFDRLGGAKRQAMLTAGWLCFGASGYRKTSMADIARAAGVSKALLFHYFGTKKAFYSRLFREASDIILEAMVEGNEDFFESVALGIAVKQRLMSENPGLYDFLLALVTETDQDAVAELRQINTEKVTQGLAKLFDRVDWSRFRVDQATVRNLAGWVSEGCIRQNADKDADFVVAEVARYFDLLKDTLYKKEWR